MPAFTNLSFELADPDGGALGWTWNSSASTHWAAFSSANGFGQRFDGFEFGWGSDTIISVLDGSNTNRLIFSHVTDPLPADGFEHHWGNDGFLFVFGAGAAAPFAGQTTLDPTTPYEEFDHGWLSGTGQFFFSWADVTADPALYGSDAFEAFETGWGNDAFIFDFTNPDLSAADFVEAGVVGQVETFEGFKTDQAFGVQIAPVNTIDVTGHGFLNNDKVKFFPAIDGQSQLPTPLSTGVTYFVIFVSADRFQIAFQSGGTAISIIDGGSGTNYVRTDIAKNWGGRDGDTTGSDP
jgi:hypothetical protein